MNVTTRKGYLHHRHIPSLLGCTLLLFTYTLVSTVYASDKNDDNQPHKETTLSKIKKKSDPLGQQPRLNQSIPETESYIYDSGTIDRASTEPNVIRRIQLILLLDGYYNSDLTGKLDNHTKDSINKYKADKQIISSSLLEPHTLTSLGIFKSNVK